MVKNNRIKSLFLALSLCTFMLSQTLETSYKAQKAGLMQEKTQAFKANNHTEYFKLYGQALELKRNNTLKKAHATEIDTQFIKAIEANDAKACQEFLNSGANVNIKWQGKPALIHALSHENLNKALIEALLTHPLIKVNAKDKKGNTALREVQKMRLANIHSNVPSRESILLDIAKSLIERPDTNLNATYEHRRTVFTQAIYDLHDRPLIDLLLANGTKVPTHPQLSALSTGEVTYFSLLPTDLFTILKKFRPTVSHINFRAADQFYNTAYFYLTVNAESSNRIYNPWHSHNFEMAHDRMFSVSYREKLKGRIANAVAQQLLATNNQQ